jgi:hypothetical protein
VTSFKDGRRRTEAGQLEQEFSIGHLIEPNVGGDYPVAKRFKWRETYWEVGRERERKFSVLEDSMSSRPFALDGISSGMTPMGRPRWLLSAT